MSKIYCEGAARAEVYFSLTGGREGKIVSDNPPVQIITNAKGFFVEIFFCENSKGGIYIGEKCIALGNKTFSTFLPTSNNWIYYIGEFGSEYKIIQDFSDFEKESLVLFERPSPYALAPSYTAKHSKEFKSGFIIWDESGILYAFDYPENIIPNYEVKCISCPPGLCAVKGENNKIECLDCKKVLGSLGRIDTNLGNIL